MVITYTIDNIFKRLGFGDIEGYPTPKVEDLYGYAYFTRDAVVNAIAERYTTRGVGHYTDTRGNVYRPPTANPFLVVRDNPLVDIPIGSSYINSRLKTLQKWGRITAINVVDMNSLTLEPELLLRYCPKYNVEKNTEIVDLYNDIVFPKLEYVNGFRNIESGDYSVSNVVSRLQLELNKYIDFPRHIDTVVLFNNMKATVDIPYIEIVDPVSDERIHKFYINPENSTPMLAEDTLRQWVENDVPNGKNFVYMKVYLKDSSIGERLYGNIYIYNTGVVEFIADLEEDGENMDTFISGNTLLNKVLRVIERDVVNFMNVDYHKYVNSNMKTADSTKIMNNIPKGITYHPDKSNKFNYYNSVLSETGGRIQFQFEKSLYLSNQFFAPFLNCLYPFITIEGDNIKLNSSVSFRTNTSDEFRLRGTIHNVLVNGRYDIVRKIEGDLSIGDMLLMSGGKGVADSKLYWTVTAVEGDTIQLSHVLKNGTVDSTKTISRGELSGYKMYYPRVAVYNINTGEGDATSLQVRWIRVNEFKRLTSLGREIAENLKKGLLKEEAAGSKRDNELRNKLRIKYGGVLESDLQELIVKIRNNIKTIEQGDSGVSIKIEMSPEILTEKEDTGDLVKKYVYNIHYQDVHDLRKISDITEFFNKAFEMYKLFLDTYTYLDVETGIRKAKISDISDDFKTMIDTYNLKLDYEPGTGFTCETKKNN